MANPQSLNPLVNNDFKFSIKRLPNVEFWSQKIALPGFELLDAGQATPFSNLPLSGTSKRWHPLVVGFQPDEHLRNYMEVFDWTTAIAMPSEFPQFDPNDLTSDATFTLLDSNKHAILHVTFINLWPFAIDDLNFDTTQPAVSYQPVNVTFLYDRWEYKRL